MSNLHGSGGYVQNWSGCSRAIFFNESMSDSFITGFKTPIICHQMTAESAFDFAKYNEACTASVDQFFQGSLT